jgi:uncharacterized protein YgbK (DUF1537 family)
VWPHGLNQMEPRWFILADDLTGAADSAIAFARRRVPARVVWGDARPEDHREAIALAYDAATRELSGSLAARRHRDVTRRFLRPGARWFKKIDSTLRGHPAEEIAAMLDVMLAHESTLRVVLAPSFPAMGRTVRDGELRVHGIPLPFSEYWPEGRDPSLANLVNLVESAGVAAHHLPLTTIRAEVSVLRAALAPAVVRRHADIAVCDAETDDDLDRIASASLDDGVPTFFIGSAGFAHALAQRVSRAGAPRTPPHRREPSSNGALVVVGSRAQASRAALAALSTLANVQRISIDGVLLGNDPQSAALVALAQTARHALAAGIDVVVDIAQPDSVRNAGNPQLVSTLARLFAPVASQASALAATGGETATALLARLGVSGLRLVDEIEPGIPLGLTLGEISIPAVTKAGGFGNEECLTRIIARLRFIRQTGTVA